MHGTWWIKELERKKERSKKKKMSEYENIKEISHV